MRGLALTASKRSGLTSLIFGGLLLVAGAAHAAPQHGISMFGQPALAPDFSALPYVNPDAPKGGTLRQAINGSFDSLNPFIVKGQVQFLLLRTYVFESLMARSKDEPFSLYGLIAESIEVADDRSKVTFRLNPAAKFSDGLPITSADVVFSMETLRDHGRPNFKNSYSKVVKAETPDERTVVFTLDGADRELVLILGLMPVIPKHHWEGKDFEATTLEPLVGSGPYTIGTVKPGEQLEFKRNPEYWGRDLAVNRGLWNFDRVVFDYYRDSNGAFEAFKKGDVDLREESDSTRWSQGYDFAAANDGRVTKLTIPNGMPQPISALAFNTRKPLFEDKRVREALLAAFDFEWANANLFGGLYQRTQGYFAGSDLSAIGNPAGDAERAALAGKVPDDILDGSYRLPVSDGTGRDRKNMRLAMELLTQAGWKMEGGKLVKDGQSFAFDLAVSSPEQERVGLHFQRSLAQVGITMNLRQNDSAGFQRRLQSYDYDMVPVTWFNSLSPGNEQAFYWGSTGRDTQGTRNYPGIADPAIDEAIKTLLGAKSRDEFVATARSIDRLLLSGIYVIPLYNQGGQWLARWNSIACPEKKPLQGFETPTCWSAQ